MYEYMILMIAKNNQTRLHSRLLQQTSIASRLIHEQALPQNKVFPRNPRLW